MMHGTTNIKFIAVSCSMAYVNQYLALPSTTYSQSAVFPEWLQDTKAI